MEESWVKGLTFLAAGTYLVGAVTGSGITQIRYRMRNKMLPVTLLVGTLILGILSEIYALKLFMNF